MVTRNDVARVAGVSSAVVSYVLNDGPRPVSTSARERVLAAIDELGYRRNSIARSMRTRTTNSIGFVLPDISLSYFTTITQRITESARARGLSVIVATSNGDIEVERAHLTELAGRQVDGVILMSVDSAQDFGWTGGLGMPVLVVDRPTVAVESAAASVQHLLDQGRHRLARLSGPADDLLTRRRDAGWRRTLDAHGLGPHDSVVFHAPRTDSAGYEAARTMLSRVTGLDGVVIDAPPHAPAFLRASADLDVVVPDDVAVVANECGASADFTVPRLTSTDSPLDEIAELAVERIVAAAADDRILFLGGEHFVLNVRESSAVRPS